MRIFRRRGRSHEVSACVPTYGLRLVPGLADVLGGFSKHPWKACGFGSGEAHAAEELGGAALD